MRTSVLTLVSIAMLGALAGCKQIEMKDGQIPAEFIAQAKAAEGTYTGHIELNDGSGVSQNMRSATMTLKIDGNRPVLTVSTDWIDEKCHSKIGPLENVQISGLKLKRVAFAFDAGDCKAPGVGDIMMMNVSRGPDGKFKLFAWVMTADIQVATEDPAKMETVTTMSHGHFQQQ